LSQWATSPGLDGRCLPGFEYRAQQARAMSYFEIAAIAIGLTVVIELHTLNRRISRLVRHAARVAAPSERSREWQGPPSVID
jgi:hypothetical protein